MKKIFKLLIFIALIVPSSIPYVDAAGACKEDSDGYITYTGNPSLSYGVPGNSSMVACLAEHPGAASIPYSSSTEVDIDNSDAATNNTVAGSGKSIKLANPLCNENEGKCVNTIPDFVKAALDIVMKVGVPLVALAIIYTGYLFIAAQGKPEELTKAKEALVYVFVGSMILLGAYVIAEAIIGTVNAIRGK